LTDATANREANPLAAAWYADRALHERVRVVENVRLAQDTFRIRLEWPAAARRVVPGQFFMLRLAGINDPLLARPLALYDTWVDANDSPRGVDIVYLTVGKMTRGLSSVDAGEVLEAWGPLGNGFSTAPIEHLVMIAGGIGQTPFLALGREALGGRVYGGLGRSAGFAKRVTMCYGVRTANFLAGVSDFKGAGIDLRVSSDDGSIGRVGFVTELAAEVLDRAAADREQVRIACCGPEKMMEAVAKLALSRGLPCEVSLETPMACGIGICFSCVAKVRQVDGSWDYKRTCVEGPIFAGERIVW